MLLQKASHIIFRGSRAPRLPGHTSLLVCCAVAAAMGCASFSTGCAQSSKQSTDQKQQTRPRRTGLEINNPPPDGTNTGTNTGETKMPDANREKKSSASPVPFYTALEDALAKRGTNLETVCALGDPVSRRILEDYGAVFVATDTVMPPPVCMFESEAEVSKFQQDAKFKAAVLGGAHIELQPAAMEALLAARDEARQQGLDITPRGGTEAARRNYADTLRLWNTRFLPALAHWNQRGRLTKEEVARLRNLPRHDQVREVLELEKRGIYFSTDFSKSILYSIAAPGTSQHITMLALDVSQFADARVRRILALHGWFQTVKSDLPHFTYLGLEEKDLPSRGLRSVHAGGQLFWIPNVGGKNE
jgi:hypothetical protein